MRPAPGAVGLIRAPSRASMVSSQANPSRRSPRTYQNQPGRQPGAGRGRRHPGRGQVWATRGLGPAGGGAHLPGRAVVLLRLQAVEPEHLLRSVAGDAACSPGQAAGGAAPAVCASSPQVWSAPGEGPDRLQHPVGPPGGAAGPRTGPDSALSNVLSIVSPGVLDNGAWRGSFSRIASVLTATAPPGCSARRRRPGAGRGPASAGVRRA